MNPPREKEFISRIWKTRNSNAGGLGSASEKQDTTTSDENWDVALSVKRGSCQFPATIDGDYAKAFLEVLMEVRMRDWKMGIRRFHGVGGDKCGLCDGGQCNKREGWVV